jgi:3-oxoadipate enol-lactonase
MLTAKINGNSIVYERRGKGAPVVLLHGFPLDHTIWLNVASIMQEKADVIMPDLRGFGDSAIAQGDFRMTDLAADLVALLDQLNIEKAAIVGHSMGGYVALAFAHAYPQRVSGLGLVSTQALADTPEKKASRYQEAEAILANGVNEVAASMSVKLTTDKALQDKLRILIFRQPAKGLAGALKAMAERPDSTSFLTQFDFPVAIVHGGSDAMIPPDRGRDMKAKVKNGSLVVVEGAGHMPMMEAPESTAGELMKLIVK